jgi:hypothetical protein
LCLTTTQWSWGHNKELVLQVAGQGLKNIFWLFPESSILNPKSPLWEGFSCYITLYLESQWIGTFAFSVIKIIFVVAREQIKRSQLQFPWTRAYFLVLRELLMELCNFLILGRLHHSESSRPFRFAKYFSLFCFCLFSSFYFS